MVAKFDAHQVKNSFEADWRDFGVKMIAGNVTLRFFETPSIVIGSEVVAFSLSSRRATFKGQKLLFINKNQFPCLGRVLKMLEWKLHKIILFRPLSDDYNGKHFCLFFFVKNLDLMSSDRRAKVENEEATKN